MPLSLTIKNDGFTLIELLISLAIFSVILGAIFSFSIAQRKYLSVQEQISEMTQNARAVIDLMSGEIAVAGYDPTGSSFKKIPAGFISPNQFRFFADTHMPANGVTTDPNEDITYIYNSTIKRIDRNTGGGNQSLAENVENFVFQYLDDQGNATADELKIRQIRLTIKVRTSKPDPQYSANSGYRTLTLITTVTPRNLAL